MRSKFYVAIAITVLSISPLALAQSPLDDQRSIELDEIQKKIEVIEEAERTQDPVLAQQANKLKAELIAAEASRGDKSNISMQDKITIIEQAKISDDSIVKQGAETIKKDLITQDEEDRLEDSVEAEVSKTIQTEDVHAEFNDRDKSLQLVGFIAFVFGLGMLSCLLISNLFWKQ